MFYHLNQEAANVLTLQTAWVIRDEGRFYSLYHSGSVMDKGRLKEVFHIQDVYVDLQYLFASVVTHDDYSMGVQKRNPLELLDLLEV